MSFLNSRIIIPAQTIQEPKLLMILKIYITKILCAYSSNMLEYLFTATIFFDKILSNYLLLKRSTNNVQA